MTSTCVYLTIIVYGKFECNIQQFQNGGIFNFNKMSAILFVSRRSHYHGRTTFSNELKFSIQADITVIIKVEFVGEVDPFQNGFRFI